MSLLDAVRAGIKVADKVTKPMQAEVMYLRAVADTSGYGNFTYPSSFPLRAIVDFSSKQVRTKDGILTVTRATVGLLDVAKVVEATAGQGIGNDDRFILPDGDVGIVLDISGFIDAGTGHPVATTVMLG